VFTAGVNLVETPPGEGAQRSAILESVLPEDRLEDSKRTTTKQSSFGLVTKTEQAIRNGVTAGDPARDV